MLRRAIVIAAVAAAAAGCGSRDRSRRVSVPWSLIRVQGRRLTIESVSGGCESFDRGSAKETSQKVTIALYNLLRRQAGEACTADAILTRSTIILDHPLGSRQLVHAPVTPGLTR
jgi:poly(3-hydroxybutyrate) depolymerase